MTRKNANFAFMTSEEMKIDSTIHQTFNTYYNIPENVFTVRTKYCVTRIAVLNNT